MLDTVELAPVPALWAFETAFFLTEQLGSESTAAKAALQAAYELPDVVESAVARLRDERLPIDASACRLNVGVHWGASHFIGQQLATSGRLEVLGGAVVAAAWGRARPSHAQSRQARGRRTGPPARGCRRLLGP